MYFSHISFVSSAEILFKDLDSLFWTFCFNVEKSQLVKDFVGISFIFGTEILFEDLNSLLRLFCVKKQIT